MTRLIICILLIASTLLGSCSKLDKENIIGTWKAVDLEDSIQKLLNTHKEFKTRSPREKRLLLQCAREQQGEYLFKKNNMIVMRFKMRVYGKIATVELEGRYKFSGNNIQFVMDRGKLEPYNMIWKVQKLTHKILQGRTNFKQLGVGEQPFSLTKIETWTLKTVDQRLSKSI